MKLVKLLALLVCVSPLLLSGCKSACCEGGHESKSACGMACCAEGHTDCASCPKCSAKK